MADPKEGPKVGVMRQGPIPKKLSAPSHVDEGQTAGSCDDSCPAGTQQEAPGVLGQNSGAHGLNLVILPATGLEPNIGVEGISGRQFTEED